jgi:hypothetical protein
MMRHSYIIVFLLSWIVSAQSIDKGNINTTERVIHALTRALHFFSQHADEVNLDAGIGTRMAADQLKAFTRCRYCNTIQRIVGLSEQVTWQIIRSVRYRQPEYFQQLSFLLQPNTFANVIPFVSHSAGHESELEAACAPTPFVEKRSDQCLHALGFAVCHRIPSCNEFMSHQRACRYSLTHQILYSMLLKQSPCAFYSTSSASDDDRMVARMLSESRAIARANFPESDRDLFMEQIAFGGLSGWNEFFEDQRWFDTIVDWQHPEEGCYGNETLHGRARKREEQQMRHQCLSHRTSVAIAALSQILRYLTARDI